MAVQPASSLDAVRKIKSATGHQGLAYQAEHHRRWRTAGWIIDRAVRPTLESVACSTHY